MSPSLGLFPNSLKNPVIISISIHRRKEILIPKLDFFFRAVENITTKTLWSVRMFSEESSLGRSERQKYHSEGG